MTLLLQFLSLLLTRAPEIEATARSVFREVGGTDAELDAALAENQRAIDRLKDPDSFRRRRPPP